jgi:hypothetical protein
MTTILGWDQLRSDDHFRAAGSVRLPAAGGGAYTVLFRLDRTSHRILSAKWRRDGGTDWLDTLAQAVCTVVIGQPLSTVQTLEIHALLPYVSEPLLETILSDPDVAAFVAALQATPPQLEAL